MNGDVINILINEGFDNVEDVIDLTDEDLVLMGIKKLGVRIKTLRLAKKLALPAPTQLSTKSKPLATQSSRRPPMPRMSTGNLHASTKSKPPSPKSSRS